MSKEQLLEMLLKIQEQMPTVQDTMDDDQNKKRSFLQEQLPKEIANLEKEREDIIGIDEKSYTILEEPELVSTYNPARSFNTSCTRLVNELNNGINLATTTIEMFNAKVVDITLKKAQVIEQLTSMGASEDIVAKAMECYDKRIEYYKEEIKKQDAHIVSLNERIAELEKTKGSFSASQESSEVPVIEDFVEKFMVQRRLEEIDKKLEGYRSLLVDSNYEFSTDLTEIIDKINSDMDMKQEEILEMIVNFKKKLPVDYFKGVARNKDAEEQRLEELQRDKTELENHLHSDVYYKVDVKDKRIRECSGKIDMFDREITLLENERRVLDESLYEYDTKTEDSIIKEFDQLIAKQTKKLNSKLFIFGNKNKYQSNIDFYIREKDKIEKKKSKKDDKRAEISEKIKQIDDVLESKKAEFSELKKQRDDYESKDEVLEDDVSKITFDQDRLIQVNEQIAETKARVSQFSLTVMEDLETITMALSVKEKDPDTVIEDVEEISEVIRLDRASESLILQTKTKEFYDSLSKWSKLKVSVAERLFYGAERKKIKKKQLNADDIISKGHNYGNDELVEAGENLLSESMDDKTMLRQQVLERLKLLRNGDELSDLIRESEAIEETKGVSR